MDPLVGGNIRRDAAGERHRAYRFPTAAFGTCVLGEPQSSEADRWCIMTCWFIASAAMFLSQSRHTLSLIAMLGCWGAHVARPWRLRRRSDFGCSYARPAPRWPGQLSWKAPPSPQMLGRRGGRGLRRHFRPRQVADGRDDIFADAAMPEEMEATGVPWVVVLPLPDRLS